MEAKEFGRYLKGLRNSRKLTIRQLDTYSGVSNSYISQMERGERGVPKPDILMKLAKPLGVSYEELMEKAGYLTREDVVKAILDSGIIGEYVPDDNIDFSDPEVRGGYEKMKNYLSNPSSAELDKFNDRQKLLITNDLLGSLPEEIKERFIKNLLDERFSSHINIIDELNDLDNDQISDVLDYIKFKKSQSKN